MARRTTLFELMLAIAMVAAIATAYGAATAREALPRFMPLFSTGKTIMGETITYPTSSPAKLTGAIITLSPGDETGWHIHGAPLTGIVLEGELTVDYGERGKRTYREGDAIAEAINIPHNGKNTGESVMRLFAVIIGAEGVEATIPIKRQP